MSAPTIEDLEREVLDASEEHEMSAQTEKDARARFYGLDCYDGDEARERARSAYVRAIVDHHASHERVIAAVEALRRSKATPP